MVYQPIGKHLADLVFIALDEEPADRPVIGHAGIFVPDRRGKEFQEPARRLVAGIGDDRRHHDRSLDGREISGGLSAGTDGQRALASAACNAAAWRPRSCQLCR